MKFNKSWIDELVENSLSAEELSDMITMAGLEVDSISEVAAAFEGVVVGHVTECEKVEGSDHLQVTRVDVGTGEMLQIVCGAPNCRKGLKVACAKIGASLPGIKIKQAKLRGTDSYGMLCSYRELGMSEDHSGIIELDDDAPVGEDLRKYLDLGDRTVDVDLTTNRSDCLSIRGIARECGVLLKKPVKRIENIKVENTIEEKFSVSVASPEAAPRYLARVIRGVNQHARSPVWMTEKLRRCGVRSVSPIVDVTNYVMLELGQPLHSFDLDKLKERIEVRFARKGEKLTVLSGQELELNEHTLLITDASGPIALAGIFGGLGTGIGDDTKNVLLESAFFSPNAIKGRARDYGLNTDASHRYERGVDFNLQNLAVERATQLLVEIAGGSVGPINECVSPGHLPPSHEIVLRHDRLKKIAGADIGFEQCFDILQRLDLNPEKLDGNRIKVVTPSFRFDLEVEEDLVEEIARIYGYNNIEVRTPVSTLNMPASPEGTVSDAALKAILVARSYQEAVTYSFTDPKVLDILQAPKPLVLQDPISPEMSAMRTTLVAGLLETAIYNVNRQQKRIRLFETGLRYIQDESALNGMAQEEMLCGLAMGDAHDEIWANEHRQVDFYDLKGDVEALIEFGCSEGHFTFEKTQCPFLHPGQGADLYAGEGSSRRRIGVVGMLHPLVHKKLGFRSAVGVFEIELGALRKRSIPAYEEISKFPSIRRDFAFVADREIPGSALVGEIRRTAGAILTDVSIFDVFESESLGKNRSIAISVILQDRERTLEDREVDEVCSSIVKALEQKFGAKLRS